MNTTEFIKRFAEAIETETSALTTYTEFRNLEEWDSINYLSVIAMLDEEYDIQIENTEFKQLKTIGDIINYIENHK